MSALTIGMQAPDFQLPATTQETIRLSAAVAAGSVLVLFYPLDFSPVCTQEMCSFRDGLGEYRDAGVQVLGISVDSIFCHRAFAEKLSITFPLLSDFNREVCRAWGACHEEILGMRGVAKRAAFLVDRTGVIRYAWVSDDPGALPDETAVRAAIASL